MAKLRNGFSSTLIWLVVAAIGVIAPITWDVWNSTHEISLIHSSPTTLVEKKTSSDKLSITYDGVHIDYLTKLDFVLKNTGRRPVEEADIVEPVSIKFTESEVVNAEITSTAPNNLNPTLKTKKSIAQLSFSLLNPGDSIMFQIILSGHDTSFNANARIKNIVELDLVDEEDQLKINTDLGIGVYIAGFFGAFFLIIVFVGLNELSKNKKILIAIHNNETPIQKGEPKTVILGYFKKDLKHLMLRHRKVIEKKVLDAPDNLTEESAEEILALIKEKVEEEPTLTGIIGCAVIAMIAGWYVLSVVIA